MRNAPRAALASRRQADSRRGGGKLPRRTDNGLTLVRLVYLPIRGRTVHSGGMHILLGLLGTIVTILFLLSRLADAGISLGGLNPFLWRRRRAWRQKFEANPLFSLDDPVEIAAILALATAKADGDMSAAERHALLAEFEHTFALNPRQAAELLTATAHLLGDGQILREHLDAVLADSKRFSDAQRSSAMALLERIASVDGAPSALQREFIERVRAQLAPQPAPKGTWA